MRNSRKKTFVEKVLVIKVILEQCVKDGDVVLSK